MNTWCRASYPDRQPLVDIDRHITEGRPRGGILLVAQDRGIEVVVVGRKTRHTEGGRRKSKDIKEAQKLQDAELRVVRLVEPPGDKIDGAIEVG